MIVSPLETGWQIIHHPAHALLAFQIGLHWKITKRPVRWVETLAVIDTHDDRQPLWEGRNHLTEAGAPLNFRIRAVATAPDMNPMTGGARQKSRWNAMLLSMHAAFIYEHETDHHPDLDRMQADLEANRKRWRKTYGTTPDQEQYAYEFVQFCDALSLVLVEGRLPIEERQTEFSKGPGEAAYFACRRKDNTISVSPWPFEATEFSIHIESYPVAQLAFQDDADLIRALEATEAVELTWTFRR